MNEDENPPTQAEVIEHLRQRVEKLDAIQAHNANLIGQVDALSLLLTNLFQMALRGSRDDRSW